MGFLADTFSNWVYVAENWKHLCPWNSLQNLQLWALFGKLDVDVQKTKRDLNIKAEKVNSGVA